MDLVRELEMLWDMRVTVVPIFVAVARSVPKSLEKGQEELEI